MIHLHPSLLRLFFLFLLLQDIVNIFVGAKKYFEEGFCPYVQQKQSTSLHSQILEAFIIFISRLLGFEF
jgi:hypothetical protein